MPTSARNTERLLITLQRLLEIPAADLKSALTHAADALADSLGADKVDAFLYDHTRDSLVAVGTSTQPLSELQKKLGLDVLPVTNGGRAVWVYKTRQTFRTGNLQDDPEELRGVKEGLKIESKLGIPLEVGGEIQGLVMICSLKRDYFTDADEAFAQSAVRWVAAVAHRAELVEDIEQNALEIGRRGAAKELVTVLAHDIRNYIGPVSARLYALRHRAEAESRSADLVDIQGAVRSISRLGDLVSNLLDVARIDRGLFALDVEPVDLVGLVKQSADALSTPDHGIVVRTTHPVIVSGDSARIRQCLDNLVANAINHSPASADVNVFISAMNRDGREWGQVEIIDEGPGIPEDVLPQLFDPFVTGRSQHGGLGLGLYLAKSIATAHGGDVDVGATEAKGCRFTVRLPIYATE